uniref:Reverse transcriptase zinc-binding domain-containing protein n=1 Tax=Tanacetum cinerariifolium TaxID=118510 RepID=A0A699J4L2_TANCI|nr:reverse transcriptase zinc-binding domain-containing protein [Tanacetum cinerariifolium]
MVPHEAFACTCGAGDVVLRESHRAKTRGKLYYACPKSNEEQVRQLISSPGASSTLSLSPGTSSTPFFSPTPSTPPNYYGGSSSNTECSNCKHLFGRIKEFGLDVDDSDLHLTHSLRSSNSTHTESSTLIQNPVTIIPGPAGVVQLSINTRAEPYPSTSNPVRIIPGPAGTIPGTIHHKVMDEGGYGKDITVGAAMILKNVLVFTPKPSEHYLNITMRNVVQVFHKYTVLGSSTG